MDSIELGKFILQRRKALDLGQKELSDALFVSIPTISKWEKGNRLPDLTLIGELAKTLKVDIESLCNLKEELNNTYDEENEFNIELFSKHFKYLRKVNDISLQDLANRLSVRYQTISKWESAESLPSIISLIECAKIFNVSIAELYYGKDFNLNVIINKEVVIDTKKYKATNIILSSLVLVLIACLLGVGINNYNNKVDGVKVTYDFDELVDDLVVVVKKGEKANYYNPIIEGYSLTYYYNEQEFNFDSFLYEDIVLKGVFTINTYTVNFYDQNHELLETQMVEYNQSAIAPIIESNNPKLEFSTWSMEFENVKTDLDVYPIFINKEADITFDANGGICEEEYIYNYDNEMYYSLPIAYKEGYTFTGWYNDDKLFTKYDVIDNPIVLFAKYKANEYEIYLNENGENPSQTIKVKYDEIVSLPTPTKEDYTFVGWYYEEEILDMSFMYNFTSNIELVAMFSKISDYYEFVEFDNSVELIKYKGESRYVEIPEYINGKKVNKLSKNLFKNNSETIKEIKLSENVETYEYGVFEKLINLEKIYTHNEIKTTLNYLFANKIPEKLKTIEFAPYKENLFVISNILFKDTTKEFSLIFNSGEFDSNSFECLNPNLNIVSITINYDKSNHLNISGFENLKLLTINCEKDPQQIYISGSSKIEKIVINDKLSIITSGMLSEINSLKEIILPAELIRIEGNAFKNTSIKTITIPDKVKTIEGCAFSNCKLLKEIYLSETTYFYGTDCFIGCKSLEKVYYNGTIESWKNILFDNEFSNPLYYGAKLYIYGKEVTDPSIYPQKAS